MLKLNELQKRRLVYLLALLLGLALAAGLILYSLKRNINLFFTPSQALQAELVAGQRFRLGGMVKRGTVVRERKGLGVRFILTDWKREVVVVYSGILPDLFREGNGAIAEGEWVVKAGEEKEFRATEILAKHDENYMPRAMYKESSD